MNPFGIFPHSSAEPSFNQQESPSAAALQFFHVERLNLFSLLLPSCVRLVAALSPGSQENMKGGRKNLKRASGDEHDLKLEDGQSMMQVLSLRGSNLIEVMGTDGEKSLALFPAKFQKSMWIKNGSFVIVDESGKEKAIESGSKVTCIVSQVLFHEQVRKLQKSPEWPEIFKSTTLEDTSLPKAPNQEADELNSSDDEYDDGLPPLVANKNRIRPHEVDSESDTGSDSDS